MLGDRVWVYLDGGPEPRATSPRRSSTSPGRSPRVLRRGGIASSGCGSSTRDASRSTPSDDECNGTAGARVPGRLHRRRDGDLPAVDGQPGGRRAGGRGRQGPRPRRARAPRCRTSAASRCSAGWGGLPGGHPPAVPVHGRRRSRSTTPARCWPGQRDLPGRRARRRLRAGRADQARWPARRRGGGRACWVCSSSTCPCPARIAQHGPDPGPADHRLRHRHDGQRRQLRRRARRARGRRGRHRRRRVLPVLLPAGRGEQPDPCHRRHLADERAGGRVLRASCRTTSTRPGCSWATPARC